MFDVARQRVSWWRRLWRAADLERRSQLLGCLLLAALGVATSAGVGGGTVAAAVPLFVLAIALYFRDSSGDEPSRGPKPLSGEQRVVLAVTIERDGRRAAAEQLKVWTGDTLAEATLDIDAAFPRANDGPGQVAEARPAP